VGEKKMMMKEKEKGDGDGDEKNEVEKDEGGKLSDENEKQ
jgi:hypothetical protein